MTSSLKSRRHGTLHISTLTRLLQGGQNQDDKDPSIKASPLLRISTILAIAAALTVFTIIVTKPTVHISTSPSFPDEPTVATTTIVRKETSNQPEEKCNLFSGDWVPNPDAPYYDSTCFGIQEHQNCIKFGRPNLDFLKWRWKPDKCELPIFSAEEFLESVRHKSIAFVGDSLGRNHLQSLICLLSKVQYPEHVTEGEKVDKWMYRAYNFTIVKFWTPFLVRWNLSDPDGPSKTGVFDMYLDEYDTWTNQIDEFDYVIINAGRWFFRISIYHENGAVKGCRYCGWPNVTHIDLPYPYRMAFRTALKAINSRENFKGVTFMRTLAPSHFEGGEWNKGGNCERTAPYRRNESRLSVDDAELYKAQVEEFEAAKKEGEEKGKKFVLFDTTKAMMMRPDGHPSRYGHTADQKVELYNDCVHWCLPGAIDVWNDMLLEMLKKRDWER